MPVAPIPQPQMPGKPGQPPVPLPGVQAPMQQQPRPAGPQQPGPTGQQPQPKQNRITTIPKPVGIDPLVILQERENRMAARIVARMEQLKNLPTNMPEDLRLQAQIELRALRCLNFQRQLRSEVSVLKRIYIIFFSCLL